MKMIESVEYLYKKSSTTSFLIGSGSKEPLGRVDRSGPVPDGTGEPARGSLIQFRRFFPAVSRFRLLLFRWSHSSAVQVNSKPVANGSDFEPFGTGPI